METARQAAQNTGTLEEIVKKMQSIDTSQNKELATTIKVIVDSSQDVKDSMLSLIKATKSIKTVSVPSSSSNIDEKVALYMFSFLS